MENIVSKDLHETNLSLFHIMSSALSCLYGLLPLLLFFTLFIGSGVYYSLQNAHSAFYQLSASVAILPAIILGICLFKGPLKTALSIFLQGARDENIIIMCLVYLLAGAFASVLHHIGGISSFVHLILTLIPKSYTLPTIFIIASLVSTAMGTSMGTIAAVGPIGVGIAHLIGIPLPLMMGTIIGGAMFGDNLSMISDTSIAATQIHGCSVKDKFKNNARIAIPCMILTVLWLCLIAFLNYSEGLQHLEGLHFTMQTQQSSEIIHGLPYLIVLGLAISGVNVFVVLTIGILTAGSIGLMTVPDYHLTTLSKDIFEGYKNMSEILILSLLMGGLSELIRYQGGFKKLTDFLEFILFSNKKNNIKVAEASICTIVSLSDICTANNTTAIIISGEATKEIAKQSGITPVRAATLVDLFSCAFQGLLPYSAQVLMAGSLAEISPLTIIPNIYYCFILAAMGIFTIILQSKSQPSERFFLRFFNR